MTQTRRQFIRGGGAVALGSLLVGPASADHLDEAGENITLEYDQSMLETYRPRLVFPSEAREKFIALYGWVAKSPDYDTDVCCYWASYTHQSGWLGNLDSHHGDHEPVYTFVDSSTGDVTRVMASVYHWLKGEVSASVAALDNDTHPHLRVVEPWHQYTAADPAASGILPDVEDLTAVYEDWLANGLEKSLHPGSVSVPWRMQTRGSWWRDDFAGISFNAQILRATRAAGYDTVGSLEAQS